MADIANKSFNYLKDNDEREEEEEQIYDSIDEDSSDSFALHLNKESGDNKESKAGTKNIDTRNVDSDMNRKVYSFQNEDRSGTIPEKLPIKQRRSPASSSPSKIHSYDEVTINFGKPVIESTLSCMQPTNLKNSNEKKGDIFL